MFLAAVIVLSTLTALSACGNGAASTGGSEPEPEIVVSEEAETPAPEPENMAPEEAEEAAPEPEIIVPEETEESGPEPEIADPGETEEAEQENEAAPAETVNQVEGEKPAIPRLIVCVGDSITYGEGVKENRETDSYPAILDRLLSEAGVSNDGQDITVLNYAVSGKALMSTSDKPYTARPEYTDSLKEAADLYIIMLGTNDAKPFNWDRGVYESELPAFLKTYRDAQTEAGKPPYLIVMIPPRVFAVNGNDHPYDIANATIRDEIRPIITKIAEENDIAPVDLYALTEDHPEWFPDGVHPNAEGNTAIAKALFDTITDGEIH